MKCVEYFYNKREALEFISRLQTESMPEMVKTMDEDTNDDIYVVSFIPPKMK